MTPRISPMTALVLRALWRGPGQFRGKGEPKGKLSTREIAQVCRISQRYAHDIVRGRRRTD